MKKLISCVVIFLSFQAVATAPTASTADIAIVEDEGQPQEPDIEGEWVTMEVTAYTLAYSCCGKHPDDPDYGITASGKYVQEHHTIAAGPAIPFGTKIYIPEFLQWFTVEDRGGAITDGHLDIYMELMEDAKQFGRQQLEVFVCE